MREMRGRNERGRDGQVWLTVLECLFLFLCPFLFLFRFAGGRRYVERAHRDVLRHGNVSVKKKRELTFVFILKRTKDLWGVESCG